MTDNIILKLENLNKEYRAKSENLCILDNLNMEVKSGEMLSIIGKSGSGKSTLLNMIGILDKPDSGSVYYMGDDVAKFTEKERNYFRNSSLGFIFQFHYLLPEFTALENVMIPAMLKNRNVKEVEKRALELLAAVELKDRVHHKPSDMSGGEKQRVAIARAMVNSPKLILADEPTGNLDEETSEHINTLLKKINKEVGQTIVVVTHSSELALITDRKMVLKKGKLEEV